MLYKIGELRKPKTNVQMIQKMGLLKYHHLMAFLMTSAPEVAQEIRTTYMTSMGRTLHTLFRAYFAQLTKLTVEVATKSDLIGQLDEGPAARLTGASSFTGASRPTPERGAKGVDAFALGSRDGILMEVDREPILVHVALAEGATYPYEAIFRSVTKHLMDAATNEYLFGMDFFQDRSFDTFNQIFSRTVSMCLENLENYLFGCWDAVGLLLLIKLTHAQRNVMQRRRVPVLDSFFDRINMLLWPRLKLVLDAHLKSVEGASASKLGATSTSTHHVTKRFAEFAASILTLHGGMESLGIAGGGEEMLLKDMTKLRLSFLALQRRLSEELPNSKQRLVFQINNCDAVLAIYGERGIVGDECSQFEELLAAHRGLFVEEELLSGFGALIAFVQQAEALGDEPADAAVVETLVRDFAGTWKGGIEAIYQSVIESFGNFRNGMDILKQVLTQLLLYYTRFQECIKKTWGRRLPPFAKDIVSTATILAEIKKYSRAI